MKRFLLALIVALAVLGCGPHHKSTPPQVGSNQSEWVGPTNYLTFEIYYHKSLTTKQRQCRFAAFEGHSFEYFNSTRALGMIGAPRWGKVWFHGSKSVTGPNGEKVWGVYGRPGSIHVAWGDNHAIPGLTFALDAQQNPLLDQNIPGVPGQLARDLEAIEKKSLIQAFIAQQFLGCH